MKKIIKHFEFNEFCGFCNKFGYNTCPNKNKVDALTRHKLYNCTKFVQF